MSEYKPITGELRNSMTYEITTAPNGVSTASIDSSAFCDLCDAIDSIHANLERENEGMKAELDRVLGEQEERRHSIGEATVTITPTLNWSAVALELHSLACHLAGDAE